MQDKNNWSLAKYPSNVDQQKHNFFICDPSKNVECQGRYQPHCGHQCFCTTNRLYSSNPDHALTHEEYYREQGIRMKLVRS